MRPCLTLLPDTGQILPQRRGGRTGGRDFIHLLVLLDDRPVEGQAGIGASARCPHHNVAAMGGGGAFRPAGEGDDRQAGAGAQLDLTLFNAAQGPFAVDDEDQFGFLQADLQTNADMVVGAYRRRTDGVDRQIKLPAGYTAGSIANASAYIGGHIRSIAVGSALVSRRAIDETRFPTGLAYDEDTLFWTRVLSNARLAVITQPVMVYLVSAERSDDRFTVKPAKRFLEWRQALHGLAECGIAKSTLKTREGLVALKIARVHYARDDLDTAARFLAVAKAAPKVPSDAWRCMRYQLKLAARRRFSMPRVQLQSA